MIFELTQRFYFEAAHTLARDIERGPSKRIHGHTYVAELTVSGTPDPDTGMLMDLGRLRSVIERVRRELDHRMLNELGDIGAPTLENLCSFLWRRFEAEDCKLARIVVRREASGDSCSLRAPG